MAPKATINIFAVVAKCIFVRLSASNVKAIPKQILHNKILILILIFNSGVVASLMPFKYVLKGVLTHI